MLENIIYHSVILIFIVLLVGYLLFLQKRMQALKAVIIVFFLEKEFIFPQNRSLFIRGIRTVEELLSEKFGVKVCVEYDTSRRVFLSQEFRLLLDVLFNEKKTFDFVKFISSPENKKMKLILFRQSQKYSNENLSPMNHLINENDKDELCGWELRIS